MDDAPPPATPPPPARSAREAARAARNRSKAPATPDAAPEVGLYVPVRTEPVPAPELADDPELAGRPWTAAAAMEPLPPLSPAHLPSWRADTEEPQRSRLMTASVVVAAAAAIFVVVASHLDLAHTQAPSFAVNELAAATPATDSTFALPGHFPSTVHEIDVGASYVGAAAGDSLTLKVTFGGTSFPPRTVNLSPGTGTVTGQVLPIGSAFQPGVYTVTAVWHGTPVRQAQFTVDPPSPRPGG